MEDGSGGFVQRRGGRGHRDVNRLIQTYKQQHKHEETRRNTKKNQKTEKAKTFSLAKEGLKTP